MSAIVALSAVWNDSLRRHHHLGEASSNSSTSRGKRKTLSKRTEHAVQEVDLVTPIPMRSALTLGKEKAFAGVEASDYTVTAETLPTLKSTKIKLPSHSPETHLHTVLKPQYSLAISIMRCRPNRLSVVPHVLRMMRCGATKSEDSLCT